MRFISNNAFHLLATGAFALTGVLVSVGTIEQAHADAVVQEQEIIAAAEAKKAAEEAELLEKEQVKVTADPAATVSFARTGMTSTRKPQFMTLSSKNFNVEATLIAARSEVGMTFPTGWNAPGECLVAAKRWIHAGGGNWSGGGTPIGNYVTATEVPYDKAAPGDIIQYLDPTNPSAWVSGVHTVLVTHNNGDGTLQIVEANNPGGSGYVSENLRWVPAPPPGLVAKTFRF